MPRIEDELPWPAPPYRSQRDELAAPPTQIVRDREAYLGQGQTDIGRRIADDEVEFFVSGDPVAALQQQFEQLAPEFIALHDVGTTASLRILGALAGAAGARVQRLAIRRQGQGVALAVFQFVEVPVAEGLLRIYTTAVDADMHTRQQLAPVLLGRSRLAVLLVGEMPPHALTSALQPLRDALARGPWPNRNMLLLPLASSTTLAVQAAQLVGGSGVVVRVTPKALRPNDAWQFISGAWNRLHGSSGASVLNPQLSQALPKPPLPMNEAPTMPMDLMPSALGPVVSQTAVRWADYALRCAAVRHVTACCIFETATQRSLAHAGDTPSPDRLALQGGLLLGAFADAARMLNLGTAPAEAVITIGPQHLLLRPVPRHPGVMLHALLRAGASDLTLARLQLDRVTPPS